MSELFDGFLTLGEFVSEPETPTFVIKNVADTDIRFYQETPSGGSNHVGITTAPKKRPSLGEMLQRSKVGDEVNCKNSMGDRLKRDSPGGSFKATRKFLKWRILKCCTPSANSVSAEKKLQKVVKIFSRKVHPVLSLVVTRRSQKSQKNENKNKSGVYSYDTNYYNLNNAPCSITPGSYRAQRNETIAKDRILCSSSPYEFRCGVSRGNNEYWDKTDPDYVVLEL